MNAKTLLELLRLPAETPVEFEPAGDLPGAPVRAFVSAGEGAPLAIVIRDSDDPEAAMNHAAISYALDTAGYAFMPRLRAIDGTTTIEEQPEALTAMQVVPPPGAAEAAMQAFAALHALPIREGLDWGATPAGLYPPGELPMHRLGFSAAERDPARDPLFQAQEVLLQSSFGFAHRDAIAGNVLLAPGRAWLTEFGSSGYGPQLFDVAAFLLTSGIEPAGRQALAASYARHRGLAAAIADDIDLLGILWGIGWLLELPRHLITTLGDDASTEAFKLCATRIDNGIRQRAGGSQIAAAIRQALWPVS